MEFRKCFHRERKVQIASVPNCCWIRHYERKKKQDKLQFLIENPKAADKERQMELDYLDDEETRKKNDNDRKIKFLEAQAHTELIFKDKRHADFLFNTQFVGYMFVGIGLSLIVTASHL